VAPSIRISYFLNFYYIIFFLNNKNATETKKIFKKIVKKTATKQIVKETDALGR